MHDQFSWDIPNSSMHPDVSCQEEVCNVHSINRLGNRAPWDRSGLSWNVSPWGDWCGFSCGYFSYHCNNRRINELSGAKQSIEQIFFLLFLLVWAGKRRGKLISLLLFLVPTVDSDISKISSTYQTLLNCQHCVCKVLKVIMKIFKLLLIKSVIRSVLCSNYLTCPLLTFQANPEKEFYSHNPRERRNDLEILYFCRVP